jgi:hypothetical protein
VLPCSLAPLQVNNPRNATENHQGSKGAQSPVPGGITTSTPGVSDRVLRALANASNAPDSGGEAVVVDILGGRQLNGAEQ